jgi:hypothetical protein
MEHDTRHGGPYDRGSADAYYGRPFNPHYFLGATGSGVCFTIRPDEPEFAAYVAGWNDQHESGVHKDWGWNNG